MSLALDKRYESITVQEILDRADVGRSTFYMHFHDKDELLRWGLQHLSNFLRCAQAGTPTVPGRSYERVIGFSLRMFQHANEYRAVIRALLSSTAETVVRRHLDSVLASIVKVEIKMEMQRRKRMRGPMSAELLTYFVVSSFVSVFTWWLNSESPLRPEDINAAYQQLVLPCLASIFG